MDDRHRPPGGMSHQPSGEGGHEESESFVQALQARTARAVALATQKLRVEGRLAMPGDVSDVGLPPVYLAQLDRWMALEPAGTGETIRRVEAHLAHYGDTLPTQWVQQQCASSGLAATMFASAIDWTLLPRLSSAMDRLLGNEAAEDRRTGAPTLGALFRSACFGASGPMLYAYPHDLAACGEELAATQLGVGAPGPVEALHVIIDRRLAAPMIHELSHGGRADALMPPILDECVSGYLGVAAMPELAYPAPGQNNGLMGAPWFAQVGHALVATVGFERLRRAHLGGADALSWQVVLPAGLAEAARRVGDAFHLAEGGVHLLDGHQEPEVWQKLFYVAAGEGIALEQVDLASLRAMRWRDITLSEEPVHGAAGERGLAEAAVSAMTLRSTQMGACFRVQRSLPTTAVVLDVEGCVLVREAGDSDLSFAPPARYLFPPHACARWRGAGVANVPVPIESFEAIPDIASRLLAGPV